MKMQWLKWLPVMLLAATSVGLVSCGDDEEVSPATNENASNNNQGSNENNSTAGNSLGYTLCPNASHPHAVDLGLPSGLKWACCNIGAKTEEDYGQYFTWASVKGYSRSDLEQGKRIYTTTPYQCADVHGWKFNKYVTNEKYGIVDNKVVLEPMDDAATVNWGDSWRMPTIQEMKELISNTTHECITINGIDGMKFTSKINGKSVFFPAAGYVVTWRAEDVDEGKYWTSSLNTENNTLGRWLCFRWSIAGGEVDTEDLIHKYPGRYHGRSIRPVMK